MGFLKQRSTAEDRRRTVLAFECKIEQKVYCSEWHRDTAQHCETDKVCRSLQLAVSVAVIHVYTLLYAALLTDPVHYTPFTIPSGTRDDWTTIQRTRQKFVFEQESRKAAPAAETPQQDSIKMPTNLTIHATKPFKSSRLALPPSPFSPRFPLSPPPNATNTDTNRSTSPPHYHQVALALPTSPPQPLNWLWQCHLCNRVYRLAITRRCLEDGHYFCSGTTTVKRAKKGKNAGKKVLRHKACASEFDYAGWKAWGVWRRDVRSRMVAEDEEDGGGNVPAPLFAPSVPGEGAWFGGVWTKKAGKGAKQGNGKEFWTKDCWGTCDYPSECRWGKQYGVTPTLPSPQPPSVPEKDDVRPKTKFEDILLMIPDVDSASKREGPGSGDGDVTMQSPPLSPELPESLEEPTRKPSFDDLLESVKRRKRRSTGAVVDVSSPLSSHPPSPTTISMAEAMDLATSSSEHVEDVTIRHTQNEGSDIEPGQTALQRAFDDFDLDCRRSFEKAGAALTGFVSAVRSTAALEEEKAETFVKSLGTRHRREMSREGKRWT